MENQKVPKVLQYSMELQVNTCFDGKKVYLILEKE